MNLNSRDLYLQAMTGADGTINVGYLVLFRAGRFVIIICSLILAGAFVEMYQSKEHVFRMAEVGDAIAKIIAAFGVLLGALGVYLWGDAKQQAGPGTTTTTVVQQRDTVQPALTQGGP